MIIRTFLRTILSLIGALVAYSPADAFLTSSSYRHQTANAHITPPSTTSLSAQIFVDLVNEYNYLTTAFPLQTSSATFGTFAGVGDALAQKVGTTQQESGDEEGESSAEAPLADSQDSTPYDPKRTQRFVLKGLGSGLIWSQWYPLVDVWSDITSSYILADLAMEDAGSAHTIAKTASSIAMEQFIACPIVYSLWDIPVPALLAGTDPSQIPRLVREKVPGLLVDNAKVWTVANVIVYNLPVQWRVFAVSVFEIFWASIVSSVATSGSSSVAFVEAQDALIDQMAVEKRDKVIEEALSPSFEASKIDETDR